MSSRTIVDEAVDAFERVLSLLKWERIVCLVCQIACIIMLAAILGVSWRYKLDHINIAFLTGLTALNGGVSVRFAHLLKASIGMVVNLVKNRDIKVRKSDASGGKS